MKMVGSSAWSRREGNGKGLLTLIDGLVMADVVIVIQFESTNLKLQRNDLNEEVKSSESFLLKENRANFGAQSEAALFLSHLVN